MILLILGVYFGRDKSIEAPDARFCHELPSSSKLSHLPRPYQHAIPFIYILYTVAGHRNLFSRSPDVSHRRHSGRTLDLCRPLKS